ncbi:hypothetical protein UMZ34_02500 [Halopseudomonas pachastrellae]|nr:hypothetical protein UMZ34_02500 [Halopseudomonas pachastrellae]
MTAEDAAALIKRQSRDVPLILLKPGIDIDCAPAPCAAAWQTPCHKTPKHC